MTFNLRLIPLLPFIGATILMLFGRKLKRETSFMIAALAIGASCVVVARRVLHRAARRRRQAGSSTTS